MKRYVFLAAILAAAVYPAEAKQLEFRKKVNTGRLHKDLVAAGYKVVGISCADERCLLDLSEDEKKNPTQIINSHVYVDESVMGKAVVEDIRSLALKLKNKTITQEERDLLLEKLVRYVLGE